MQESCPYGSVRGAPSNGCPYRNRVLEPSQFIRLLDTGVRVLPKGPTPNRGPKPSPSSACLPICWAEQCKPDILLYRSPYKCFLYTTT
jgi:hypothetical protein